MLKETLMVALEKLSIGDNKGYCAERSFDGCVEKTIDRR